MPEYECKVCNFSSKIKCNYLTHLKTKKHIKKVKEYGALVSSTLTNPHKSLTNPHNQLNIINSIHQDLNNNSDCQIELEENQCEFCGKIFSRPDNLKRHMEEWCKKKNNIPRLIYLKIFMKKKLLIRKNKERSIKNKWKCY